MKTEKQTLPQFWTRFETAFGECAFSWNEKGVTGFYLPPVSATGLSILKKTAQFQLASSLPKDVKSWTKTIQAYLKGQEDRLHTIPLHFTKVTPFCQRVYEVLRKNVTSGMRISYKELGALASDPTDLQAFRRARAVGMAMRKNPIPLLVPCHRVCAHGGGLGGFSAPTGVKLKKKLLDFEAGAIQKIT